MKIKTSELSGAALDWAVAKCEGATDLEFDGVTWGFKLGGKLRVLARGWAEAMTFLPSSNWAQGGPIIERERIQISPEIGKEGAGNAWWAVALTPHEAYGHTPLIAAMRCYCCAKLGDEIDIPEELCQQQSS